MSMLSSIGQSTVIPAAPGYELLSLECADEVMHRPKCLLQCARAGLRGQLPALELSFGDPQNIPPWGPLGVPQRSA